MARVAARSHPRARAPGWDASPSVTATTTVSTPARPMYWSRPPAPRTSSSGCGATTTSRRGRLRCSGGSPASRPRSEPGSARLFPDAARRRLAPRPPLTCHMAEDVGVLRAVVLGQIHVEIGGSLGLLRIEDRGRSSPGRGGVHQNLLRCVVHGVTNHKGSSLRRARTVVRVVIDLFRRLLDHPAHEIDVGDGMSKFGQRRVPMDSGRYFAARARPGHGRRRTSRQRLRSPRTRTRGARGRSWAGRWPGTRRQGRPSEIEGFAQRIRHSHRGPGSGMDPNRRSRPPRHRIADIHPSHSAVTSARSIRVLPEQKGFSPARCQPSAARRAVVPPARGRAAQTP